MEIPRGVLTKMILMIMLITILGIEVHCSIHQPQAYIPISSVTSQSPPDHLINYLTQLQASIPISFVTPNSLINVHHSSFPKSISEEIERASSYPWEELIGKKLEEAVMEVEKIIPSASIFVQNQGVQSLLKNKGSDLIAIISTDNNDTVTGILVLAEKH